MPIIVSGSINGLKKQIKWRMNLTTLLQERGGGGDRCYSVINSKMPLTNRLTSKGYYTLDTTDSFSLSMELEVFESSNEFRPLFKISKEIYFTLKFYQVQAATFFLAPNYYEILTSISHIEDFALYFSDPLIISPRQLTCAEPGGETIVNKGWNSPALPPFKPGVTDKIQNKT